MVAEEGGAVVRETAPAVGPWWRRADWGALLVVVVVLASSATSLRNGFAYDDLAIIEQNDRIHTWRWPWLFFTESYWGPPYGVALYRPVTMLLFWAQWLVGDGVPITFHLVSVTAYTVAALLVLLLARCLVRPTVALGAAVLWAAHPVHVEVVGNVVGQSELWVALASLAALLLLLDVRTSGALGGRRAIGLVGCSVLALGAKENGIILVGVIAGLLLWDLRRWPGGRARNLGWVTVRAHGYLVALYLTARYGILGALGGDAAHLSLAELSSQQRLLAAAAIRLTEARLLLLGGPFASDYSPPAYPLHPSPDLWHLGAAMLLVAFLVAAAALRRAGRPLWPMLWMIAALAPTSNVLFPTGIVLAERSLFVPSLAAALIGALLMDLAVDRVADQVTRGVRRAVQATCGLVVAAAAWTSAERQLVWRDSHTLAASSMIDAPLNPAWQRVLGLQLLRMQEFERAEVHLRIADSLGPPDFRMLLGMRSVLAIQGRCDEALGYDRRFRGLYPSDVGSELNFLSCLLRVRRFTEARRVALLARTHAFVAHPYTLLLQLAESALVATDTITKTNAWARAGRPTSRSDAPILVEFIEGGRLVRRQP